MQARNQTVLVDGVGIHIEYYPANNRQAKETFVLIHGYLSSTFSFRRLIPLLAENHEVIAIDLPGFGQSEKSRSFIYSLSNYGKLVLSVLDRYHLDRASLIGHSMGGQVALHAAQQAPDRIKSLLLLASSGYLKPFKHWLVSASYLPFFPWLVRKLFERNKARDMIEKVVYDTSVIDEFMVETYTHPMQDRAFYRSLIGLLRHHGGDLTQEALTRIDTPVLLLWGKQDRIVPLAIGKRLEGDLPKARLKVFENTGHLIPEERPAEVCQNIINFMRL